MKRWNLAAVGALSVGMLAVTPSLVDAAAAGTGASGTTPTSAGRAAGAVTHAVSGAGQRATLRYWTVDKMKRATSLDVVGRPGAPARGGAGPIRSGTPRAVAPSPPSGHPAGSPLTARRLSRSPALAQSYPYPFTRGPVMPKSKYTKYPWSVNGKLFFTQNGGNFVCSGTSVTAAHLNEVWTAGHCVSNGAGKFDSFAEFVPAYNGAAKNPAPEGVFVANYLSTSSDWHHYSDLSRDLGAIRVNKNANGVSLGHAVGTAGFAWNQPRHETFVDFGYPQAAPFNGRSMIVCRATTAAADTLVGGSGAAPTGIGCDMTGGSSGGSWDVRWNGTAGNAGYINGHNDYHYIAHPRAMYSPYFDRVANVVRCAVEPSGIHGC
jgi:V8-like Glu-specific endopeptidase